MIKIVMGAPGSGKTTYLAYLAKKAMKKGRPVYSNVYIENAIMLNSKSDLNTYLIENALIIIDEGGNEFDNRSWKSFDGKLSRFFQMHRHYGCDVIISCQHYEDIDVKIKRLVQKIEVCKGCLIPYVNKVKKISIDIMINPDGTEIIKQFAWLPFFCNTYYIAPLVWKMFNSYYRDILNIKSNWDKWTKDNEAAYVIDYTK